MVKTYLGNDDDLSTRPGVGCRECGREVVKVLRERCDVFKKAQALLLQMEGEMADSPAVAFSNPAS